MDSMLRNFNKRAESGHRPGDSTQDFKGFFSRKSRTISFQGDVRTLAKSIRNIQDAVNEFIDGGGDTSDLLQRLKNRQIRRWIMNYNQKGAEYGKKWVEYERKPQVRGKYGSKFTSGANKRYNKGSTLLRSGWQRSQHRERMEDAAQLHPWNSELGVSWKFSNAVDDKYYAVSHHTGYTFGNDDQAPIEVPARQIWDLDDKDERLAYRMYREWAYKKFGRIAG